MVTDWMRNAQARAHAQPQWQRHASLEQVAHDGRYHEPGAFRPLPMTVERALREQCHIPVAKFFLAVQLDNGQPAYFSGPEPVPEGAISRMFSMDRFLNNQRGAGSIAGSVSDDSGFPFDDPYYSDHRLSERRLDQAMELYYGASRPANRRKRARARRATNDDDEPLVSTSRRRGINIGNAEEVWSFYDLRFRNCQQTACKLIGKAWVKAVAPKKQSTHPYTGDRIPDWWPTGPFGSGKTDYVRHREPDHLLKKERVHLICHILRMIVQPPEKQHPNIQALKLNVTKLEELTNDTLSSFFSDKNNANNAKKKPFLKEIFKVAHAEEEYLRGQRDAGTEIFVMSDDKGADSYLSDDEDEDEPCPTPIGVSPATTPSSHCMLSTKSATDSPASNPPPVGVHFLGPIPTRSSHYTSTVMPTNLSSEQHSFAEGSTELQSQVNSMQLHDMLPSQHHTARRTSLFNSPTEYPNACGPAGLYSGTTSWSQQATSTAGSAPLYTFPPQQQHQQQQPPPQTQTQTHTQPSPSPGSIFAAPQTMVQSQQQYVGTSFDSLPHPGGMYRNGSIGQAPVAQQPSYGSYMAHDGRPLPGAGPKHEPLTKTENFHG
ncbi:hypothetical protein B0T22DRAFT_4198 [Podospora appendiculata]|uniref:Subtelomeric hrmA-associated cluster protein AFUB-079030/YDR124W-like helical bundle domain-containing protein n=1 Tax=Podospora appendiculata TaxID=314037 RepID=A0AAE0XF31_9PEZI|nr:hypothetical protein B0T22DRAFT_4198 [Podospora appendiculata]